MIVPRTCATNRVANTWLPPVANIIHVHERPTFCADLALILQFAFVADDDYGEIIFVLDAQYLVLEGDDLFKALSRGDAVDEEEAFAGAHVLFAHCRVLFLASGIENVEKGDLIVDDALLAI